MNQRDTQFEAQKIRAQYTERQTTELDALHSLDRKVKRPANIFAYTFGSIAAIVMGAGMSLVMTEIGTVVGIASPMVVGIVIGIVGMGMALLNYPIYKGILKRRKKKYGAEILALSEKIMNR